MSKNSSFYRTNIPKVAVIKIGDTENPLWTVDWYTRSGKLADDGIHFIVNGPWASSSDNLAFGFFKRDKLIKLHKIKDLLKSPLFLNFTASHFRWRKNIEIDNAKKVLNVTTLHQEKYTFDIETGEIINSFQPPLIIKSPLALITVFLLIFLAKNLKENFDKNQPISLQNRYFVKMLTSVIIASLATQVILSASVNATGFILPPLALIILNLSLIMSLKYHRKYRHEIGRKLILSRLILAVAMVCSIIATVYLGGLTHFYGRNFF